MPHKYAIGDLVVSDTNYEVEGKTSDGKTAVLYLRAGTQTQVTSLPRTIKSQRDGNITVIGVRGMTAYGADSGEIAAHLEDISPVT